jgi:hypothetical protein
LSSFPLKQHLTLSFLSQLAILYLAIKVHHGQQQGQAASSAILHMLLFVPPFLQQWDEFVSLHGIELLLRHYSISGFTLA